MITLSAPEPQEVPVPGMRERKKLRTRGQILSAAQILLSQKGVADTSLREIAELADVSEATLYKHFPCKQDLVDAVVHNDRNAEELIRLVHGRPDSENPLQALLAVIREQSASDDEARLAVSHLKAVREDDNLLGAYLRRQVALSELLAVSLAERGTKHGFTRLDLRVAIRCFTAIADAVADDQPPEPSARRWLSQLCEQLERFARSWPPVLAPTDYSTRAGSARSRKRLP